MFNGIFDPWQIAHNREGRLGPGQRLFIFLSIGMVFLIGAFGILLVATFFYSLLADRKPFETQDVIIIIIFGFGGVALLYYGWKKLAAARQPINIRRIVGEYNRLRDLRIGINTDYNQGMMTVGIDGSRYVLSVLQVLILLFRTGRVALYYIDWEYDREVVNFEFFPPGQERKRGN